MGYETTADVIKPAGSLVLHLEDAAYRKHPALARSSLDHIMVSPAHFQRSLTEPRADTAAFRLGRLVHSAVLEPDKFWPTVALFEGARRFGKVWDAFKVKHAHKTILSVTEHDQLKAVAQAVKNLGMDLQGHVESSIFWRHERTGVDLKARLDLIVGSVVFDLKTTRDLDGFVPSITAYGYHRQAAWYLDAAVAAGLPAREFVFIAAEKKEPYAVQVHRLTYDLIELGREENEANLTLYKSCLDANRWPEKDIPAKQFWRPEMDLVEIRPAASQPSILELSPDHIVTYGAKIATTLADVIEKQKLFNNISGRKYVKVEGWLTLGSMLGVFSREKRVTELPDGSYEAVIELFNPRAGVTIGEASAICGVDEKRWKTADKYARRSMAITRATGKAYRMTFSWIMSLAGYEGTPEEEMPEKMREAGSQPPAVDAVILYDETNPDHKIKLADHAKKLGVIGRETLAALSASISARPGGAPLAHLEHLVAETWEASKVITQGAHNA